MMPNQPKWMTTLMLGTLACLIALSACSPTPPPQLPTATATALPKPQLTATQPSQATATAPVITTNTAAPTPTATLIPPTSTPIPTATPNLALAQDGLSAWCLPEHASIAAANDPFNPPSTARIGKIENGALEIRNMPFSICVFIYTFNQPAPAGLKLDVYDKNLQNPWLSADLLPAEGKPNTVITQLRHTYITNPRLWNVSYQFVVRDSKGNELHRDQVNLHRWISGLCWQGNLPDPYTLYCPLQQDLHPWDIGYGKKLPTVTPKSHH